MGKSKAKKKMMASPRKPSVSKGILVKYSSNNSGGSWWLKDEHWLALEKAGWKVEWEKDRKEGLFRGTDGRFLGALAQYAEKVFATPRDALREFEQITGQDVSDEGCNCCGAPHSFSWEIDGRHDYASGESCLPVLFGEGGPSNLRAAYEARAGEG